MYSVVIIDDNKIAVEAISKSTDWEKCGCRVAGHDPHFSGSVSLTSVYSWCSDRMESPYSFP